MTNMTNLFATEGNQSTLGSRGLSGTAQLTSVANSIATSIINTMNDDVESYRELIKESQKDNGAMDKLIETIHPLADVDIEFLKEIDDNTIEGMLKSQQSKRSRCKSKAMTIDNYKALMTGAIAENLIRMATGKEKNAGGARRTAGTVDYTIEQLQQLSEDQEKLRREIRNVQSKKSIMKSKADFNENDERWQSLLKAEQQLKDMRVGVVPEVIEVDTTKDALNEMFEGVDLEHLKAADSKELLARIQELVGVQNQQ